MCQILLLHLTSDNYIGISQTIATLIVGVATIITYFRITKISRDATAAASTIAERSLLFNKLNQDLDRIVEYTIQFPYFEDEKYQQSQYRQDILSSVEIEKEKALRYELFAIMNFNFVQDLFAYYNGDEKQMGDLAEFTELVKSHGEFWRYKIIEKREGGYTKIESLVNRILGIRKTP